MILERHLRALLKRFGIDEYGAPGMEQWLALLAHLSDQLRQHEDEKHRLQRSLDIHGRELQSLYRELMTERDHLSSALACLSQGFLIFNAAGHPVLMNAEAEQWLGYTEHEVSGHNFLEMLQLDRVLQLDDLQQQLVDGRSITGGGLLTARDGSRFEADLSLQPILRDGQLAGSVLTFEFPDQHQPRPLLRFDPEVALDDVITRMRELLTNPAVGAAESSIRTILREAEEALVLLNPSPQFSTQEELVPVPEPIAVAETTVASLGQSTALAASSTPPPVLPPKAQPAAPDQQEPSPPPAPLPEVVHRPPTAKPAVRGLRVLLVEDESVSQLVTQSVLEKLGHDCTLAENGVDALRLHQAAPFDAIISTYLMPGMDGIALCRAIREDPQGGYPYFILLTAMDKREEATRALEAGVDAFLTKPLDANDLAIRLKVAKGVQTRLTRVYSEFAAGGEV